MALQGLAYFPGIQQIKSASYTRSHGIDAGLIRIDIVPQQGFPQTIGDVQFTFDTFQATLTQCLLDFASFRLDTQGFIIGLNILDRRWKWKTGEGRISGFYNLRNRDGTIKPETVKAPQDLAKLLFAALSETSFDVGDMPNDTRPLTEWDADKPTEALQKLLDDLGCRLMLTLDNRIVVRRVGIGAALPAGGIVEDSLTLNPPQFPDSIQAITAPVRYQGDWLLEAVGVDNDGTLKTIDNLSFKPEGGWTINDLPYFNSVVTSISDRELARSCVLRWYRMQIPAGGLAVPGFQGPNVTDINFILPLLPFQNDVVDDHGQPGGIVTSNKPASVHGVWVGAYDADFVNALRVLDPADAAKLTPDAGAQGARYYLPFSIDTQFGIVKFSNHVFSNSDTNDINGIKVAPAQLRLRCCINVRDATTRGLTRYFRPRNYANNGTPPRCLVHDEVILSSIPTYNSNSYDVQSVAFNYSVVNPELDYYLNAAELDYQFDAPETIRYAGLINAELDGAIQQITYEITELGAFTTVARNNEQVRRVLPYKERRNLQQLRQATEKVGLMQPTLRARKFVFNVAPLPGNFWAQDPPQP